MKKIFSSVLIAIILSANLLAPISVVFENNNIKFKENKTEATGGDIRMKAAATKTDTTITVYAFAYFENEGAISDDEKVVVMISDADGNLIQITEKDEEGKETTLNAMELSKKSIKDANEETLPADIKEEFKNEIEKYKIEKFYKRTITGLKSDTTYNLTMYASHDVAGWWQSIGKQAIRASYVGLVFSLVYPDATKITLDPETTTIAEPSPLPITTNKKGETENVTVESTVNAVNEASILPECTADFWNTIGGCFGQLLYLAIFKPTSMIFSLTGVLLDISVDYSIKDTSYRSDFVVEGWGVVRDFCNLFFIFVLLYVAFGTILDLHGVKTKEMIINVVIIGLMMNFSLFATQIIIDTSNIITRVFYNSESIAVGPKGDDGKIREERGSQGEIKLSEAIVSKINPQTLIMEASKIDNIKTKYNVISEPQKGITAKTFILVTILSSIINIVGMLTFLSCALLFITRVIGLWLAMILVPLAFFSYTVPSLSNMETFGWKNWWPNTLKMAFMGPVFVFFMYLIIKFLNTGLGLEVSDNTDGINFVLGIFVPFIFIMILLTKAKSITEKMSGEMGQSITNGIKAVGSMALGGAALGTAMIGRKVIGSSVAAMSRSESAKHLATQKFAHSQALEKWEANGRTGPKPVYVAPKKGDIIGKDKNGQDIKYKKNIFTSIGGNLNKAQKKVGAIDHARHEEDETMKSAGLEGRDRNTLSGEEIKTMEGKYKQNKRSDAESAARKGVDAKGNDIKLDGISGGENAYKSNKRKEISDRILKDSNSMTNGDAELGPNGNLVLTKQGEKKLEDELSVSLNIAIKKASDEKLAKDFITMRENANKHVNPMERAFSTANKSSYDIRNLSEMKTDRRESGITKASIGLAALIATGVRSGLRGSGLGNSKVKVEGDFIKDLGNTISDSLKSMKINVNLSNVAEHKSSADSHAGGDHH